LFSGSAAAIAGSIDIDFSPVAICTSGVSPLTLMTSLVPPISMTSAPTAMFDPGLTISPERSSVLNEGISTLMV
jgi:hypothetical protein